MNRAFIISLATAVSLGYAGGFASSGLIAKAGHAEAAHTLIQKSYPSATPAIQTIWTNVKNAACIAADTELEMDPGTCAASMNPCSLGTVVSLLCAEEGQTNVTINFAFDGHWSPGSPQ